MTRKIDITGKRYGKLLVLEECGRDERKNVLWKCKCDCGNYKNVNTNKLVKGNTKSCGCLKTGPHIKDLAGKKFGSLTVIELSHTDKWRTSWWKCLCDCGNYVTLSSSKIQNRKSSYCMKCKMTWRVGELCSAYWNGVLDGARRRKIEFDIDPEDAYNLFIKQNGKCAISGVDITLQDNLRLQTASLDRKNSSLAYSIDNVQWVHKEINIMKQSMDDEYFIDWCETIARHRRHNV
jgi:hypothetical protein